MLVRYWLMIYLLLPGLTAAAEFRIAELSARQQDGVFVMHAEVSYDFPERPLEALKNGVPLTLEVHVQLRRAGAWIWERDLIERRLRYQVRYHALASVYQVMDLQSEELQDFVTLESALAALGEIPPVPLIGVTELAPAQRYELSVKASLDIESLPVPLRAMAYITPSWNLSSEWKTWLLAP